MRTEHPPFLSCDLRPCPQGGGGRKRCRYRVVHQERGELWVEPDCEEGVELDCEQWVELGHKQWVELGCGQSGSQFPAPSEDGEAGVDGREGGRQES